MIEFENKFTDIIFDEIKHKYYVNNKELISVTTLIDRYCQEFNQEEALERSSKKLKKSKEEILKEWKKKMLDSSNKGKFIHFFIEKYLKKEKTIEGEYSIEIEYFINFYNDFLKNKFIIYIEKIIYNLEYKIAGTIDCLVYCPINNILYFIDWKTNEKIEDKNKYQKLLKPLMIYDQCEKEIYSIQLSLYRFIIENEINLGNYDKKNILIHLSEKNNNYKMIELPYYKYSISLLLKDLI